MHVLSVLSIVELMLPVFQSISVWGGVFRFSVLMENDLRETVSSPLPFGRQR